MSKKRQLLEFGIRKVRGFVTPAIVSFTLLFAMSATGATPQEYVVKRTERPINVDANWNKKVWRAAPKVELSYLMGDSPHFRPRVEAKMAYDTENFYVIFRVKDRFVHSVVTQTNGPVWKDSCVEIFFAADFEQPLMYYNLEVNCGGTALMCYNMVARSRLTKFEPSDVEEIEIAHSLPSVVDPQITRRVTWTIECRIPIAVLQKYARVTEPAKGVVWRANLYKTASEKGSNPHYLTWSEVQGDRPDFHLPQFFGILKFE